jgi:hypothetical protein
VPLRQHAIGVIENFARLVDEHFQQIGVDIARSSQCISTRPGLLLRLHARMLG